MKYYIVLDNEKKGPYDLITMIKKIRTGSLKADSMVMNDSGDIKKVYEFSELNEIISDNIEYSGSQAIMSIGSGHALNLVSLLKDSGKVVSYNQMTIAYAGIIIVMSLILAVGLSVIPFIGHLVAFTGSYILYSGYMIYSLKLARGQHVDLKFVIRRIRDNLTKLALCGATITCAFAAISSLAELSPYFMIVAVPGLFIFTIFVFVPLIAVDHSKWSVKRVMQTSKNKVLELGIDDIGIIFALIVLNFIALFMLIVPLVFILPLTSIAIAYVYDEVFTS